MKRRRFLWLSVAGTAALSIPFLHCTGNNEAIYKVAATPLMLSGFCDEKTLRHLGEAYRQQTPSENSRDQLATLLLVDDSGKEVKEPEAAAIKASLKNRIRQDFQQGRINVLNGWILSRTEARQCALFSLL